MLRVNNLTGFGGGAALPITATDDGDFAPSSGTGTNTHTFNSKTSTGPDTILCITADDGSGAFTITSVTWGGNAVTELVQVTGGGGTLASIFYIEGAQSSGNVVVVFSGSIDSSRLGILSLDKLQSSTPVDTDSASSASANSLTLSALSAAPSGGIRIATAGDGTSGTSFTWTWAGSVEFFDINTGVYNTSGAYKLNDTAGGNITAGAGSGTMALVGVTMR